MSFMTKPKIHHPNLPKNKLGLTTRDYEGGMSTLCAGCGHDSITAGLIEAVWALDIEPFRVAKMSGIGCSSKTPAYFLREAHGINAVHGRMPSIATGAQAANPELHFIGVSGDGDSLNIGFGQFAHAIRRDVNMLYIIENNGVYGLTKGQFSASADVGSKAKYGQVNENPPIDPVLTAITLGCGFVARGFSGDKEQLIPLIQAGLKHNGFALIDVISPCVAFNDHQGSSKSYAHTREFFHPAIHTDFIPPREEIKVEYEKGRAMPIELHDGSTIVLRKIDVDHEPTNRAAAIGYLERHREAQEIVTGLLYVNSEEHEEGGRKLPARSLTGVDGVGDPVGVLEAFQGGCR
ncbi:2-oxoglutarate ferredoxin oxidoreductase subunit beta [Natronospira proteinivora]|uniref:2-oxoglutarate ferredoxin oxidoreductase subunit beta n=1 Tax=Natronospira proteinivora TaxID=1807133 RepID=A0ABT1G7J5_9GAMM|nr:2-oxoacid:ferredoxin oxidoreductase subunit beta [Natronospira proteinivora]MCP1727265.1 2-oxoglutarate ferredoxin oxidoreductase subunit beta [Natronospira proteinivora]